MFPRPVRVFLSYSRPPNSHMEQTKSKTNLTQICVYRFPMKTVHIVMILTAYLGDESTLALAACGSKPA